MGHFALYLSTEYTLNEPRSLTRDRRGWRLRGSSIRVCALM